jgi:hypothetical protein
MRVKEFAVDQTTQTTGGRISRSKKNFFLWWWYNLSRQGDSSL